MSLAGAVVALWWAVEQGVDYVEVSHDRDLLGTGNVLGAGSIVRAARLMVSVPSCSVVMFNEGQECARLAFVGANEGLDCFADWDIGGGALDFGELLNELEKDSD